MNPYIHNDRLRQALELYLEQDECVCLNALTPEEIKENPVMAASYGPEPCMYCIGLAALENRELDKDEDLNIG